MCIGSVGDHETGPVQQFTEREATSIRPDCYVGSCRLRVNIQPGSRQGCYSSSQSSATSEHEARSWRCLRRVVLPQKVSRPPNHEWLPGTRNKLGCARTNHEWSKKLNVHGTLKLQNCTPHTWGSCMSVNRTSSQPWESLSSTSREHPGGQRRQLSQSQC